MKGFANLELMIVIVIVLIAIFIFIFTFYSYSQSHISIGLNGVTEIRCIEGYKFIVGQEGQVRQIFDSAGKGLPCLN